MKYVKKIIIKKVLLSYDFWIFLWFFSSKIEGFHYVIFILCNFFISLEKKWKTHWILDFLKQIWIKTCFFFHHELRFFQHFLYIFQYKFIHQQKKVIILNVNMKFFYNEKKLILFSLISLSYFIKIIKNSIFSNFFNFFTQPTAKDKPVAW